MNSRKIKLGPESSCQNMMCRISFFLDILRAIIKRISVLDFFLYTFGLK